MKPLVRTFISFVALCTLVLLTLLSIPSCSKKQPETKEIKIGAILPLTGDIASYGVRVKAGAEIALEELQSKGLPAISIEFQDDENKSNNAVSIMKTFCSIKHYPIVIGAAGSSVSMAIAPIANRYKVVQLSPLSSSEELSVKGGEYFFRVCPTDDQQAKILTAWIAEKAYDKVAVVYTDNAWGTGLAEAFRKYYKPVNGQIEFFEGTKEGEVDFRTILAKIQAEGCKAIISPTYPKEGGMLVRQAKELGLVCDMYGADNWGAPEFVQIAGSAADGCLFVAQYSYDGSEFQNLNAKYKAKNGSDADVFVAYGYDAVYAIAHAIKNVHSSKGVDIRNALISVRFQGTSGLIEFAENGDLKTNAFIRKTIVDGKAKDYD